MARRPDLLLVDLGDRVAAGQLLVRLDPREARFAIKAAIPNSDRAI